MPAQTIIASLGVRVQGELSTDGDATTIARVPLVEQDLLAARTVGLDEVLVVSYASLIIETAGLAFIYFDADSIATAAAIVAADATANTFVIAGDREAEFISGRTFTVANSTGNDGAETSTGSSYDQDLDQTTITIASVADDTDDGDITSDQIVLAGSNITRGVFTGSGGESKGALPDAGGSTIQGPRGYGVFRVGTSTNQTEAVVHGFIRKRIRHTLPLARQAA